MTKPNTTAKVVSRSGINGNVAFLAVVAAAYATIFLQRPLPSLFQMAVIVALGLVFSLIGTYGHTWVGCHGKTSAIIGYFVAMILLGTAITYLSQLSGAIWLLMYPVVAQGGMILSWRWLLVLCLAAVATFAIPAVLLVGFEVIWQVLLVYPAGIIFVVLFSQITLSEQQARAEVERLATELGEANQQLREYAVTVEELATARERNRLAREIHDSLGHYLTVVNVQIEAARAVMDSDRPVALSALDRAQSLAKEGLGEVRRSVASLRASPIENRTLVEALTVLAEECRAAGVEVQVIVEGQQRQLSAPAVMTLYRVGQEGLTNVRKHARATHATVTLFYDTASVRLVVHDDGVGTSETEGGFGLLGLRERVQLLEGDLRVRTAPGQGFTLAVEVSA